MADQTSRVPVQTYVSAEQRDEWRSEADELEMSQAEYVRCMVQAGRRSFSLYTGEKDLSTGSRNPVEDDSRDATPGVDGLEERILEVLREQKYADWDELVEAVTDDIEGRLEDALDELQSNDRVRYSGRHGGYSVVSDGR